ncbi:MAG: hypothetical protein A3B74_05175 [Candidatus Kerfeldbacteria bacterium RIFCSPHIGHO2_02_FULL_42_14]|uniref:Uncharacterized protein n=1 Tax=Candidatus Kerfeldbacteria bacterium RIFCSPHIGHO2_02_FULL_42_14 TaxID=1798540 RepID=A0A1G2AT03_9BACT|nr:MAG: hypothetical protein A3B74_05175 [Candidatus Kerfeldbacteria bacterium RIFCSPHIGHO2_02_FULL_42_14]OGY81612.1 MAG: hypothetical protein A3E60_02075 [Candidatus Kerfeldbacteria bacterium RIFCSPHIGHO2_12_FULL_42_13]OGY83214.1 MAG: hypothetical protein A3I91_03480 [Candidatus Kerfeldbacteria bacterium RIFCSPLOWO2_02_FULL_42_19]OGY85519.1 MAG: hypothetical protein A3G01_01470 [Candidatus Kerfeldbacteria bacterium RIFCSPLOWO2_12_FULL_43_9]
MNKRILFLLAGIIVIELIGLSLGLIRIKQSQNQTNQEAGGNCGGIAGLECPENYVCYYPEDANFPDAMGECIPQYVDRGSVNTGVSDWPTYTNEQYNFSIQYPNDWGVTTYSPVETHFTPLSGESMKFIVFDYSDAPATATEMTGLGFTKQELDQKKTEITTNAATQNINDAPVYMSGAYDKSAATLIRKAEFFVGDDYVLFTMPVMSNLLPDSKYVVDFGSPEQLDAMIAQIERGEAGSDATQKVEMFDAMLRTLQVQ